MYHHNRFILVVILVMIIVIYLLIYLSISLSYSLKSFTITGCTGTLGQSLCKSIYNNNNHHKIYGSYVNITKAIKLIDYYQHYQYNNIPQLFYLNYSIGYNNLHLIDKIHLPGFFTTNKLSNYLIHNIGICLQGNHKDIIIKQIIINALIPIRLSDNLLRGHIDNNISNNLTIINISSGDGESVYINNNLYNQLTNLKSLIDFYNYINHFIDSFDIDSIEVAYGETPGYSLSKAILNIGSQLLHKTYCLHNSNRYKVVCVCPGNFLSPMTNEEEINSAVDSDVISNQIINEVIHNAYHSGRFYRNRNEIPW